MNEYALAFSRLWEWQAERIQEREAYLAAMNTELETECRTAFARRFPRRKFSLGRSRDENAEEHAVIFGRLKAAVSRYLADWYAEKQQIDWALAMLADKADVPASDAWRSVYSVSDSTYSSQGWGARKYARADANAKLMDFLLHVPEGRVEDQFHPFEQPVRCASGDISRGWYEYHVMVPTTELGGQILLRKPGVSLRDFVRHCWKSSVNPRVYLPFLPCEYEAHVGLDYFGNEIKPTAGHAA